MHNKHSTLSNFYFPVLVLSRQNLYSGHVQHILLTTHLMWKGQPHHWDLQGVRHHRRRGLKMCLCDSKNTLYTDTDKQRKQGKERMRGEREREREGLQRGIMKSWMNWMLVKRFWLQQPHLHREQKSQYCQKHIHFVKKWLFLNLSEPLNTGSIWDSSKPWQKVTARDSVPQLIIIGTSKLAKKLSRYQKKSSISFFNLQMTCISALSIHPYSLSSRFLRDPILAGLCCTLRIKGTQTTVQFKHTDVKQELYQQKQNSRSTESHRGC